MPDAITILWRSVRLEKWRDDIDITGKHSSFKFHMLYNMLNVKKLYTYMNVVVIVCL